jgi:hypothetical protein
MATRTDAQLTTDANVIKNETAPGANTATRVGNMLVDAIDSKVNIDKIASPTVVGTTKLYTDLAASNTDGAVTQAALRTSNFNTSGSGRFDGGIRTKTSGPFLKIDVIEIGDWNMDATASVSVAHGIGAAEKIRSVSVVIRNDIEGGLRYNLSWMDFGSAVQGAVELFDDTSVQLSRLSAGSFDNTNFDSTSYNRGWITIVYEA